MVDGIDPNRPVTLETSSGTSSSEPLDVFAPTSTDVGQAGVCVSPYGASSFMDMPSWTVTSDTDLSQVMKQSYSINRPIPTLSSEERLENLAMIPREKMTDISDIAIRIGMYARDYFPNLSPAEIVSDVDGFVKRAKHLTRLTYEVIAQYTDGGSLPNLGVRRVVGEAFLGMDTQSYRIDLDVTYFNSIVDATGSTGDQYIPIFQEALTSRIKLNKTIAKLMGKRPVVIRLPERTGFVVFGSNAEEGAALVREINRELPNIVADTIEELKMAQAEGKIPPNVDLSTIRAGATVHHSTIRMKEFMKAYKNEHGLKSIRQVPEPVVIDRVIDEFIRLAGETIYLRSHPPKFPDLTVGDMKINGPDRVPAEGEPGYEIKKAMIEGHRGFIPLGSFGPGFEDLDPETKAKLEFPNDLHRVGRVSRYTKGIGLVERFMGMVGSIKQNPWLAANTPFLHGLKGVVGELGEEVLNMAEDARRDPRYRSCMRSEAEGIEQAALQENKFGVRYDHIAAVEVDDGRAFGMKYPTKDFVDSDFQTIKKTIFDTAMEMGMYSPVVVANGDQIRVFVSSTKMNGEKTDGREFFTKYQQRVNELFSSKKFQVYKKVKEQGQTERIPVWLDDNGGRVATHDPKPGYKAFTKGLTVTIAFKNIGSVIATPSKDISDTFLNEFKYVDDVLKTQKGEYVKEGLNELPDQFPVETRTDIEPAVIVEEAPALPVPGKIVKAGQKTYENARAFARGAREVSGSAVAGAATFLFAQSFVSSVLGEPGTEAQAVAQGYEVLGLAVLLDHASQDIAQKMVWGKEAVKAAPFGVKNFLGGLGVALMACKGIDTTARAAGASPKVAEITGLVGTGLLFGGARALAKNVLSASALKLAGASVPILGEAIVAQDVIKNAGVLAVEAVAEDGIEKHALDEWYISRQRRLDGRSFFGDEPDVPWYEQALTTVEGVVSVPVPESVFKLGTALVHDDWMEWCEDLLRNGAPTCLK